MFQRNKRPLLFLQGFTSLGQSMIGIFFPFLIAKVFDLTHTEVIFYWAISWVFFSILVLPINAFFTKYLSTKQMLQFGTLLQAIFYLFLGFASSEIWILYLLIIVFVFHLSIFWPTYNFAVLHATSDGKRGDFMGNYQIIMVLTRMITPILSGFLLDWGLEKYILFIAVFFFLMAIFSGKFVSIHNVKIKSFKECWKILESRIIHPKYIWGFIAESIQSGFLFLAWPIYLKAVLGKFSLMGIVTAISAMFEVVSAKFFGKLTDKISSKKMLRKAVWARMADLGIRALYVKFQNLFFVSGIQILTGVLGPIFNTSYGARLFEIGEKGDADSTFEFFVMREIVINIVRAFVLAVSGVVVWCFGEIYLGILILPIALSSLGFRRF